MGWSSIFLLLLIVITSLFSYLILNLNTSVVLVDLLFYDLEISLGMILLIFFLVGFIVTISLEIIYSLRNKGDKGE
tara:strand:+ start:1395 stop:1622 length:228 start_codon:yes stop_codon:yes gene_type:complete